MTAEEKARFGARSRILKDTNVSHAATRLFLYLDDEVKGQPRFSIRQQLMALAMGLGRSRRRIVEILAELRVTGYLKITHTMRGNVYAFGWIDDVENPVEKSAIVQESEHSQVQESELRVCRKVNTVPIDKNLQESKAERYTKCRCGKAHRGSERRQCWRCHGLHDPETTWVIEDAIEFVQSEVWEYIKHWQDEGSLTVRFPGPPDETISAAILAAVDGDLDHLCRRLRSMSLDRSQRPKKSYAWFPAVLGKKQKKIRSQTA